MHVITRALATVITITFYVVDARAQVKAPDFSGRWAMNATKSDFGPMAAQAPSKIALTIEQSATNVKFDQVVQSSMGESATSQSFPLDGTPIKSERAGMTVVGSAKLDGNVLRIESKLSRGDQQMTQVYRWTLSPDSKALTVNQQLTTPAGPANVRIVFDKQ